MADESWELFNFYLQFNDGEANETQITAMICDHLSLKYMCNIRMLIFRKESRTKYYRIGSGGWAELFLRYKVDIPKEHRKDVAKHILKN